MTHPRNPSRRDFLAASAIGLFGLARGPERPPDGDLLYVGTYTAGTRSEGIYLLRMDRRSGELRQMGSVDAAPNPSFLGTHPNGRFLYAVNELERYNGRPTGAVSAFAIVRDTGAALGGAAANGLGGRRAESFVSRHPSERALSLRRQRARAVQRETDWCGERLCHR